MSRLPSSVRLLPLLINGRRIGMTIQRASKFLAALALVLTGAVIPSAVWGPWLNAVDIRPVQAEPTPPVTDTRQRVPLTPAEREVIRREMRMMLRSLNLILHGLADGNAEAVEQAARASGKALAFDSQLEKKLPPRYTALERATHRRFDQVGAAAKGESIRGNAVVALAGLTGYCVVCHDTFQVDEVP